MLRVTTERLITLTPDRREEAANFWRESAPADLRDLLEAQMSETTGKHWSGSGVKDQVPGGGHGKTDKEGYWDGGDQKPAKTMTEPPASAKSRTMKADGSDCDALTEMCMKGGEAVKAFVEASGSNFVGAVDLAGVVADSMKTAKDAQQTLAASNEIAALLKAKGKGKMGAKDFAHTIGKHFGVATPWKAQFSDDGGCCAQKGKAVKCDLPDGKQMHGKVVSVHTKPGKIDGVMNDHADASDDAPMAKVHVHESDDDGTMKPTGKNVAVLASKLSPSDKMEDDKGDSDDKDNQDQDDKPKKKGKKTKAPVPSSFGSQDDEDDDEDEDEDDEDEDEDDEDDEDEDDEDDDEDEDEDDEDEDDDDDTKARYSTFSKLTREQRERMDRADFGDPERRLFPIMDQSDVDAAARLVGKANDPEAVKARIKKIAKRKGLEIPEAWKGGAQMSVVFSLETVPAGAVREDGDHVIIPAPIVFRCGDYPDKKFSLSPEEAIQAVAEFRPVEFDLEHKPSVFNGKLGALTKLDMGPDGWTLSGEARIPKWLHGVLPPEERKISAAWDRKTKKIIGCSFVRNPRITDAALMAAFSASEDGRETLAAFAGAPAAPRKDAKEKAIESEAAAFADAMVDDLRILPAGKAEVIAMYVTAAKDDAAGAAPVLFSGEPVTRTEMFRRMMKNQPKHGLTQEQVKAASQSQALFNQTATAAGGASAPAAAGISQDRRKELLSRSTLGRAVLDGDRK